MIFFSFDVHVCFVVYAANTYPSTYKIIRALLVRDWLCTMAENKSGQLDIDDVIEKGKSYVNDASASQIDVDVISALDDLKKLKLINQYEVKEDQAAQDTLKQLWNDALD